MLHDLGVKIIVVSSLVYEEQSRIHSFYKPSISFDYRTDIVVLGSTRNEDKTEVCYTAMEQPF